MFGFLSWIVKSIFGFNRRAGKDVKSDVKETLGFLVSLSGKRVREFIFAVPVFLTFIKELVKRREEFETEHQLVMAGVGVMLGSLPIYIVLFTLSSLPVQMSLAASMPLIGVPLLAASTTFLFTLGAFLFWLLIYILNGMFSSHEIYVDVRNRFLPQHEREIIDNISEDLRERGVDIDRLAEVAVNSIKERGKAGMVVDLEELNVRIERASKKVSKELLELLLFSLDPSQENCDSEDGMPMKVTDSQDVERTAVRAEMKALTEIRRRRLKEKLSQRKSVT